MERKLTLVIIAVVLLFPVLLWSQEKVDTTKQEDLMAEYQELAQPSDEHKLLESLVGKWEQTTKFWQKPGGEPIAGPGTTVNKMILGGRFLVSEWENSEGEMQGEGLYILGFDRRSNRYTFVGFDTWGTYYLTAEGTWDEAAKTLTFRVEDKDPVRGFTQKYDYIIHLVDDDNYVIEVVFKNKELTEGLPEFKMVESTFTRVK